MSLVNWEARWKILALLVAARIGLGFQFQTVPSTTEFLIADLNLDYTTTGSLIGLFMLTGLFLAIPAGWLGRYYSDRMLSSAGLALLAIGGVVAATASGETQIGIGRLICGAGFVLSTIYFAKMTTDWFAGKELATAMGLLVMTWPLGIAVGQIMHTWLADNWHWSAAFHLASAACALGAIAVLLAYRPPVETTTATPGKLAAGSKLSKQEILLILIASLSWAFFNAGYVVFLSYAPNWLIENSYSILQAAAITSVASWVMMLSGAACGYIADKTGKRDTILYLCMTVAVITILALYFTDIALISCLLFGLIGAAPAGVIMALTGEAMKPQNRALGIGIFFSAYFVLVAPAPMIAGWLVDTSKSSWLALVLTAALFAATAASYLLFKLAKTKLVIT